MTGWLYIVQTVSVGAASFLLGFLAGRLARDVSRIAQTVTVQGGTLPTMPKRSLRRRVEARTGATIWQLATAVIVIALGVVTVVQSLANSAATRRIATCNEAYANALADVIDARSEGTAQSQNALDQLMTTIGRLAAAPPASDAEAAQRREESRKAITDYVTKRAEVKALQEKNPYPQPPRESCPR